MAKRVSLDSVSARILLEESYVDAKGKTKWRVVGSVDRRLWRDVASGSMLPMFSLSPTFSKDCELLESLWPSLFKWS